MIMGLYIKDKSFGNLFADKDVVLKANKLGEILKRNIRNGV